MKLTLSGGPNGGNAVEADVVAVGDEFEDEGLKYRVSYLPEGDSPGQAVYIG